MAFESLTDKLQNVFKNLRSKGKLSEAEVKAALREVRMALLEADVSFKVVKQFINSIQEKAVGAEIFGRLDAGQTVIKIVNEACAADGRRDDGGCLKAWKRDYDSDDDRPSGRRKNHDHGEAGRSAEGEKGP